MDEKTVNKRVLALLEEARILLNELSHDLRQEVKRVWLIHLVSVRGTANKDNMLEVLRFDQVLEESIVFTELGENLACVKGHVHVILVLNRELVDEGEDHHRAFFFEHLLHFLLVICKLLLSLLRVDV